MGKIFFLKTSLLFLVLIIGGGAARAQTINLQQQSNIAIGNLNATPRFAAGDVNNDGFPDLVTLNKGLIPETGPVTVFLNSGTGGFGLQISSGNGLSPNAVVIRDFNRDGSADLAIAGDGITNGIQIRPGNGTGNFPVGAFIAAERGSPVIVSADFNGDGNFDIATCTNVNELRLLHGNGAGGFGTAIPFVTANFCTDMAVADFNVDGRPDIALATRFVNTLQLFLNNGAGGFNAPVNTAVNSVYQLVAADFNRDCIPDLAATQFASNTVVTLTGNGAGGFTVNPQITVTNTPAYMSVGDFNLDRKVDLVVRRNIISPTANNLTILPGNGAGGFGAAFEMSVAPPNNSVEMRVVTLDMNLDGKDDLIVGREGGFLLFQNDSSRFARTEHDYDADGRADLSVFRPSLADWFILRSTQGFIATHWGISTDKPAPADYDGDFKTDLAVWRANGYGDPNYSYFFILQSSNNTFRQEQFGSAGDLPAVGGDWDGDGRADAAVYRGGASAGAQSYFFYRPSASPGVNFHTVTWGISGDQPVRGDFDGDGRMDAAVFRPSNGVWYVLKSSDLQPIFQFWGISSDRPVPADYDGDSRTDFAVFRPSGGVWYILNSGSGTPAYRQWGISTDTPVPADYNGDGKAETAVYRPSEQIWYAPQCGVSEGVITKFGASGDVPLPAVP
jgi:hypothetical protein